MRDNQAEAHNGEEVMIFVGPDDIKDHKGDKISLFFQNPKSPAHLSLKILKNQAYKSIQPGEF